MLLQISSYTQQIYDYYDWMKEKSEQNEILQVEAETLERYLELKSQNSKWSEIKKLFNNTMDFEMYRDVQYVNGHIFYSYVDFSNSIYKP